MPIAATCSCRRSDRSRSTATYPICWQYDSSPLTATPPYAIPAPRRVNRSQAAAVLAIYALVSADSGHMEVLVPATTHPLADLAATLTATLTADTAPPPAGRVAAVLDAAVRAAAGMTGDAAAVRLAGVPGPAAVHHADPDRAAALARLLAETGDTDHPVVLDTGKAGPAGFAAVVVCPLRAGDGHLGYLALARTGTAEADVDLARGIAGEVA